MKICFISPYPPLAKGMWARKSQVEELQKLAGVDVFPWNLEGRLNLLFGPLKYFQRLKMSLKSYDIVHIEYYLGTYYPLFLPVLFILAFGRKAKIVLRPNEDYANNLFGRFLMLLFGFCFRNVDLILTHTNDHKNKLPKWIQRKTIVHEHGIIPKTHVRSPKGNSVLISGFINPWKGHDVALKAIDIVRKEIPDVKLHIVGKIHDKEFGDKIIKLCDELQLKDNVSMNLGYVPDDQFEKFFSECTIAVLPYSRITMSGVLCHMMEYGIPCVMSDLPVFKEFTMNKALFFKPGDHEMLAKQITKLLLDSELRKKMSESFAVIKNKFSWKSMAKRSVHDYQKLIDGTLLNK